MQNVKIYDERFEMFNTWFHADHVVLTTILLNQNTLELSNVVILLSSADSTGVFCWYVYWRVLMIVEQKSPDMDELMFILWYR